MLRSRSAWLATLLLASPWVAVANEPVPAPSAAQIATWIKALDSEDFDAREEAGQKLAEAGRAAVAPVAQAILSDSPEVAWRANDVLEMIGISGDEETLELVTKALADVSKSSKHSLAKSTSEVQRRWKRLRHERAVAQIAKLGGQVRGTDGDAVAFAGGFGMGGFAMPVPAMEAMEAIEVEAVEEAPLLEDVEELEVRPARAILEEVPAEAPVDKPEGVEPAEEEAPAAPRFERAIPAIPILPLGGRIEIRPFAPPPPPEAPGDLPVFKDPFAPDAEALEALDPPPAKGFFGKVFRALRDVLPVGAVEDLELPGAEEFLPVAPDDIDEMIPAEAAFAEEMMGDIDVDSESLADNVDGVHAAQLGKDWKGGVEGLKLLKDVAQLSAIEIHELELTEAHLRQLGELPELRQLNLQRCRFERVALDKLKKARPDLTVLAYGPAVMGISGESHGPGFHISFVAPGSGAQLGGLQIDDLVVRMAGEELKSFEQLTHLVASRKVGDKVSVEVLRGEKKVTLEVILKARDGGN